LPDATLNIMGRARPFHDIKVWGARFNDSKKKSCSTDTYGMVLACPKGFA
jgi:hypothetical protein